MPSRLPLIELRIWLPWAAVACLAALVAVLGEIGFLDRIRIRVLGEQAEIAAAALKSTENELEVERILDHGFRKRPSALRLALLAPAGSGPSEAGSPAGAVAWDARTNAGTFCLEAAPPPGPGKAYQLWLETPDGGLDCGRIDAAKAEGPGGVPVPIPDAGPGGRFLLILGPFGGSPTLAEAKAGGSIVLASLPLGGNISSHR
jgi:hypothetical protein